MISLFAIFMAYLVMAVFASYIVTLVLVKGHLFTYPRCAFRIRTIWLIKGPPGDRRHPIDCRMCTGAWVSAAITFAAIVGLWAASWWAGLAPALGLVGTGAFLGGLS